jgi:hypothetical protein
MMNYRGWRRGRYKMYLDGLLDENRVFERG